MNFPLPGPLCEAHSTFLSPLGINKPMIYRVEGSQSVTAPAFVPVVRRVVGGLYILRVAHRL
jgi:hypothetical protein